ncbi:MAG: hypothetical protein AB7T06_03050 [Kofleriaceae bacterium]
MRWLLALSLVACSSDPPMKSVDAAPSDAGIDATPIDVPDAADPFDMELPNFARGLCSAIFVCSDPDGTQAACEADVVEDMLALKAMLDDAREAQCVTCMRVTAEQADAYVASGCDMAAYDEAAIVAVCDLTPDNGTVDTDEACGGSP